MFQITEFTYARLASLTPRVEKHGDDTNVLLDAGDLGTFEGFLDGTDDAGAPIWRDVTAVQVEGVTDWAEMPQGRGAPVVGKVPTTTC